MLKWRLVFSAILFISITFILYLIFNYSDQINQKAFFPAAIVSFLIIYGFYNLFTRGLRNDLNDEMLELIEFKLDDKLEFIDDDPGIGKDGWTSPYVKYRFISGEYRFSVSKELFENVEVGESYYVPTTINSKIEFDPIKK